MLNNFLQVEKKFNESSNSLNWHKERLRELETKLMSLQEVQYLLVYNSSCISFTINWFIDGFLSLV